MGLFGSSRKKPRDTFQAAVEQQRRRTPAAGHRQRQSQSVRRRNAEPSHHYSSFPWHESTNAYPYEQPGFGFYSGENLAAGRPRQQDPQRSMSADEGYGNIPPGFFSDPSGRDFPFLPYLGYPGPNFGGREERNAGNISWLDIDAWSGSRLRSSPYTGPGEHFLHPEKDNFLDYLPNTRMPPLGRSMSSNSRQYRPRSSPWDPPMYPKYPAYLDRPIFDSVRPFRDEPLPDPYTAPVPYWNGLPDRQIGVNPFTNRPVGPIPGTGTANRQPRPPGSYERLRPPHLQPGNSRAGSRRGYRSSSTNMEDMGPI